MSIYVDDARNRLGRMVMCHMIADTEEELHAMADKLGLSRSWFQPSSFPHYDLTLTRRKKAVDYGAIELSQRELVNKIQKLRRAQNG